MDNIQLSDTPDIGLGSTIRRIEKTFTPLSDWEYRNDLENSPIAFLRRKAEEGKPFGEFTFESLLYILHKSDQSATYIQSTVTRVIMRLLHHRMHQLNSLELVTILIPVFSPCEVVGVRELIEEFEESTFLSREKEVYWTSRTIMYVELLARLD